MITFVDGPAAGQILNLARAPLYLRVVRDAALTFDALDQLEDQPRKGETILVYQLTGKPGAMHIYARGKGARSGWFRTGTYKLVTIQPKDEEVRTTENWRRWTLAQPKEFAGGKPLSAND